MGRFDELQALLDATKDDFDKFYVKGVMKAGTRVRKGLKAITQKIKEIRTEVASSRRKTKEERKAAKASK